MYTYLETYILSLVCYIARVILCNVGEVYIFECGLYILALEHARCSY